MATASDDSRRASASTEGADPESARSGGSDGPAGAARRRRVAAAYASVSDLLVEHLEVDPDTHWELLEAAEAAGLNGEALAAVGRLTRIYEQAAYAPEPVSPADSEWALRVARQLEALLE